MDTPWSEMSMSMPTSSSSGPPGEAGELAAVLQWADGEEAVAAVADGGELRGDFADEMADVMIYLARLADVADIDLCAAVESKMERNEHRFPPLSSS
jgi:NTP pyrophosphatase (non-canonical NTP hydrolase)